MKDRNQEAVLVVKAVTKILKDGSRAKDVRWKGKKFVGTPKNEQP